MTAKRNKLLAWLMTFLMLLGLVSDYNIVLARAAETKTIAAWNYTAEPDIKPVIPATEGDLTATLETNATYDKYSSYSLSAKGWENGAESKYWLIKLSTSGYEDLTLSAKMRSSNTGPADFRLDYSIDGGKSWTPIDNSNYRVRGTSLANAYNNLPLPKGVEGAQELQIRVIMTTNNSMRSYNNPDNYGDEVVAEAGINNINNIVITGIQKGESPTDPVDPEVPVETITPIKDARAAADRTVLTVKGTVIFKDGRNVVVQDDTAGINLYFSTAPADVSIGDVIKAKGTKGAYNGLEQLASVAEYEKLGTEKLPSRTLTIKELLADYNSYESTRIHIKGAELGTINSSGNTVLSQGDSTINIYRLPALTDIKAGDVVDLYAVVSDHNGVQLRVASASDIAIAQGDLEYEEDVTLELARWAGNKGPTTTVVYGDKHGDNDYLDKDAELTLSTGAIPVVNNNNIGSTGLSEGQYYQLKLSSEFTGNLSLAFRMRGSNTGAKNFKLLYSIDGKSFVDTGKSFSITTAGTYIDFSAELPREASNAKELYLRLQVADSTSINGGTIGTGGTNYLQQIVLTANPLISDAITRIPRVIPEAGEVLIGQEITMTSATEGAKIYYSFDGIVFKQYDPSNKPRFTELPAVLTVYASSEGRADSFMITHGYSQPQVEAIKANPNGGAVVLNTRVTLSSATEGAVILYSFDEGKSWLEYDANDKPQLTFLPATLMVKATKEGYKDSEVTPLKFTKRINEKYNIYFGQIHSHTNYSDGIGTPEEAYTYARDNAEQIDFFAITDHSNSLDNADKASILDGSMSTEWVEGNRLADKFNSEDFVAMYAYEMTWSNGNGHMNTYNTNGFQSRTQTEFSGYGTGLKNYYDALKKDTGSISQFNHPGKTFGDFQDFGYYDEEIDSLITLIEVGNGEGAIGSSGYFRSYDYYTRALDKGWHLAPTNNQDNHKGVWGNANTGRTVALADSLTRENVYDAMRNMRVYATEDNDLNIYYTLDGFVMGTILEDGDAGDTADIKVEISDATDASIGTVQVIVNGGMVAASKQVTGNAETVTFSIPENYSYYYIKVIQPDGDIAVTAPVWVGEVEAAGISDVSTSESLPIQGEELDIALELYNNESAPLNISSVEFSIDGSVIHAVDLEKANLKSIASMSTAGYSFRYTHQRPGSVDVEVTVTAELNGALKVYKDVLKLKYVAPEMVTRVVIDGTHYNDYVTGYYGGNMNNFKKIAGDKYAHVNIVTDKLTEEILNDCDLLIITAPARRNGTANAGPYTISHFSNEFIELVKSYVDRGGSLIVSGLADYQDTADGQSSIEINKLLEAIGATTRLNSDQLQDDENNGGQSYRLYLTDTNSASPFTKGIVEGQIYSFYSGSSVRLDSNAVASGKAEYLVKGHPTTYTSNMKDFGGNYVPVPKGEAVALARETLDNGSDIFIAGTVFMSDFEIQTEVDNIWDMPYSNRNIMENILENVKQQMPLSTIAEARAGELGDVFAVEGIVTAGTAVKGNIFFDAIYIQDQTGGITIFPYAEPGLNVGAKVRVTGYLDQYQGDIELQVIELEILDNENLSPIEPEKMSAKDAMDYAKNGGKLIETKGIVTEVTMNGDTLSQFRVKDSQGNIATIFIDGYILSAEREDNSLSFSIKVGQEVSAVGLLYKHPEGDSEVSVSCLRVRNLDEIKLLSDVDPGEGEEPGEGKDPEEGGKPGEGGKPIEGSPKTGDSTPIVLYTVLFTLSAATIIALFINKARRKLR